MKNNIALSVIVPSIRKENWHAIIDSIENNIGKYSYEVIFIGPDVDLPESLKSKKNIKCIRDFGCPSRAMQIGSIFAEGKYLSWICDDGVFVDGVLNKIINQLENENNEKLLYNWIYTEGDGYKVGEDLRISNPEVWYKAKFHANQKHLKGIDDNWFMTLLFTVNTNYYKKIGGINCKYETINYNLHDLGYRITRDGGEMRFTDDVVFRLSWQPAGVNRTLDSCPVLNATILNDDKILNEMYGEKKDLPIHIDINNWAEAESVWGRKWNKK